MTGPSDKEVNFYKYCDICIHKDLDEKNDPCNECLTIPFNYGTEKPIYFQERERKG